MCLQHLLQRLHVLVDGGCVHQDVVKVRRHVVLVPDPGHDLRNEAAIRRPCVAEAERHAPKLVAAHCTDKSCLRPVRLGHRDGVECLRGVERAEHSTPRKRLQEISHQWNREGVGDGLRVEGPVVHRPPGRAVLLGHRYQRAAPRRLGGLNYAVAEP